jgi:hypothetical protein
MRRGVIRQKVLSMKIDPARWLVLELKGSHDWNLRVVGPEPLYVELAKLTECEAMDEAVSMAKSHFGVVNPRVIIPGLVQWREALVVESAA